MIGLGGGGGAGFLTGDFFDGLVTGGGLVGDLLLEGAKAVPT